MSGTDSTYYGTTTNDNSVVTTLTFMVCPCCRKSYKVLTYEVGLRQMTCGHPDCVWAEREMTRIDRVNVKLEKIERELAAIEHRNLRVAEVLMED